MSADADKALRFAETQAADALTAGIRLARWEAFGEALDAISDAPDTSAAFSAVRELRSAAKPKVPCTADVQPVRGPVGEGEDQLVGLARAAASRLALAGGPTTPQMTADIEAIATALDTLEGLGRNDAPLVCSGLVRDACAPSDDAWKDEDDRPLPEDDEIHAAFPTRSERHDLYGEAMRLVGARYSKGGLVALVNMLLHRNENLLGAIEQYTAARDAPGGPDAQHVDETCDRGARFCVLDHTRQPGDCHDEDGRPAECVACSGGVTKVFHEQGQRCHRRARSSDGHGSPGHVCMLGGGYNCDAFLAGNDTPGGESPIPVGRQHGMTHAAARAVVGGLGTERATLTEDDFADARIWLYQNTDDTDPEFEERARSLARLLAGSRLSNAKPHHCAICGVPSVFAEHRCALHPIDRSSHARSAVSGAGATHQGTPRGTGAVSGGSGVETAAGPDAGEHREHRSGQAAGDAAHDSGAGPRAPVDAAQAARVVTSSATGEWARDYEARQNAKAGPDAGPAKRGTPWE